MQLYSGGTWGPAPAPINWSTWQPRGAHAFQPRRHAPWPLPACRGLTPPAALPALLLQETFPWFLPTFLAYPYQIQRVDAIRYFILYHYGGVYMDLDMGCRRRLDFMRQYNFTAPLTHPGGISNDVLAAAPGDAYMRRAIGQLRFWNRFMWIKYIQVRGGLLGERASGGGVRRWGMESWTGPPRVEERGLSGGGLAGGRCRGAAGAVPRAGGGAAARGKQCAHWPPPTALCCAGDVEHRAHVPDHAVRAV